MFLFLIEREDSEKQQLFYYPNDHVEIHANQNKLLAQVAVIFSTHVSYLIRQKYTTRFVAIQNFM